jgi:hypothetical protein
MLYKTTKLPFGGKINQKHSICHYKRRNMSKTFEILAIGGNIKGLYIPTVFEY